MLTTGTNHIDRATPIGGGSPDSLKGDLLKGVKKISDFLGLHERQVFHLCSSGQLPGTFKLGRLWYARKSALLEKLRHLEESGE